MLLIVLGGFALGYDGATLAGRRLPRTRKKGGTPPAATRTASTGSRFARVRAVLRTAVPALGRAARAAFIP